MLEPIYDAPRLRRALGGRLRTYRPKTENTIANREFLLKAINRGELILNGFNRWRLIDKIPSAIGWTFVSPSAIETTISIEEKLARRESGDIFILKVDDNSFEKVVEEIENVRVFPRLLLASRDWIRFPNPNKKFNTMLLKARQKGFVVHLIASVDNFTDLASFYNPSPTTDQLKQMALRRKIEDSSSLHKPIVKCSRIEKQFGKKLESKGMSPIPQKQVAQFFLDYGIISNNNEGLSIRLDIEIDGRFWHEEVKGLRKKSDNTRDRIVKMFGWRPIRFWDDEIKEDETKCIDLILNQLRISNPETQ